VIACRLERIERRQLGSVFASSKSANRRSAFCDLPAPSGPATVVERSTSRATAGVDVGRVTRRDSAMTLAGGGFSVGKRLAGRRVPNAPSMNTWVREPGPDCDCHG